MVATIGKKKWHELAKTYAKLTICTSNSTMIYKFIYIKF